MGDSEYRRRIRPLVALAFVGAPLLLLASGTLAAVSGGDTTWQGVLGQFGGYLLVPVYLTLASMVGELRPRLGVAAAIVGLVGSAATIQAFAGYFAAGLLATFVGFDARDALAGMSAQPTPAQMAGGMVGLTVPLSMIFLGACGWITGVVSRLSAGCLILAGAVFMGSQAVLNNTGEWISPAILLVGLAPVASDVWKKR